MKPRGTETTRDGRTGWRAQPGNTRFDLVLLIVCATVLGLFLLWEMVR